LEFRRVLFRSESDDRSTGADSHRDLRACLAARILRCGTDLSTAETAAALRASGRTPVRVAGALLFHAHDRLLTFTIARSTGAGTARAGSRAEGRAHEAIRGGGGGGVPCAVRLHVGAHGPARRLLGEADGEVAEPRLRGARLLHEAAAGL